MIKTWEERQENDDNRGLSIDYAEQEIDELRAALKERDAEIEQLRKQPAPIWVKSALQWAGRLIKKEYPAGHNGADSWLMNYAEEGAAVRLADHREWEESECRWVPVAPENVKRKLVTQRAVMEQALWALQYNNCYINAKQALAAITALKGALK